MFLRTATSRSTGGRSASVEALRKALDEADAVLVGAGAGLSAAAGFAYAGPRFTRYFGDFIARYRFADMYSGGFYPFGTLEEHWAYWSRYIWINRYADPPRSTYRDLLALVEKKDYFVLTTNVDHCFQKAGFDKGRLFYTQGDYGLWQCSAPCCSETYENEAAVRSMVEAQGFFPGKTGLELPAGGAPSMAVPPELVPRCPRCGRPLTMNLRADDTFVEDAGWHRAAARYEDFLRRHRRGRVLFLELGVGMNTPVIIKYPFWRMTARNPAATYACVNLGGAFAPPQIASRALCLDAGIHEVLTALARRDAGQGKV